MGKDKRLRGRAGRREEARAAERKGTLVVVGLGVAIVGGVVLVALLGGGSAAGAAPDWSAVTIDGERVSGDGLRGDVYVVDFFFTWCPRCAKQFPAKVALVDEFAGREDFHFFSINSDPSESRLTIERYRDSHAATWPFVLDQFGLYEKFDVDSRPFLVFVDRGGNVSKIFRSITPAGDLIREARGLLDEPRPEDVGSAPEGEADPAVNGTAPPARAAPPTAVRPRPSP